MSWETTSIVSLVTEIWKYVHPTSQGCTHDGCTLFRFENCENRVQTFTIRAGGVVHTLTTLVVKVLAPVYMLRVYTLRKNITMYFEQVFLTSAAGNFIEMLQKTLKTSRVYIISGWVLAYSVRKMSVGGYTPKMIL